MSKFRDTFDSSRTVEIVKTEGDYNVCRVYFDGKYCGNTKLSAKLFDAGTGGLASRIGFVPVSADAPIPSVPKTDRSEREDWVRDQKNAR